MKKNLRLPALLASLALATSGIAGCSGGSPDATPDSAGQDQVLRVVHGKGGVDKIDFPWLTVGSLPITLLYQPLVIADGTLREVSPALAKSWEVSEDEKTYTFTLGDQKWDDGEPVTGSDVVWSVNTALKAPKVAGLYTDMFKKLEGGMAVADGSAESISGVSGDGQTVSFTLEAPDVDFLPVMAQFMILPEHLLKDTDPLHLDTDPLWSKPVGNGIYKLKELNPGNFIEYEVSDTHEGPTPTFSSVVIQGSADPVSDAQSGKIDYFNTNDVSIVNRMANVDSFVGHEVESLFYRYFVVNVKDNPRMQDPKVREALMYAIDRDSLATNVYSGVAGELITGVPASNSDLFWSGANEYKYDPEKAKSLLEAASYDFSQPLRLRFYYEDDVSRQFMTAISQQLQDIGMEVELLKFQGDSTTELFETRNYDIALKGFSAFSVSQWYGEYTLSNFESVFGEHPDMIAINDRMQNATNEDERKEAILDAQKWEQENNYKLPMFTLPNYIFISNRIKTPDITWGNPFYVFDNHIAEWEIDK
ncbi:MAG: ABC transporter substrate-binding protein [Actinomycetaceae bacterium]|nr:ABC transporter substrate-binding protein [Actinomycetaceae bacterium]